MAEQRAGGSSASKAAQPKMPGPQPKDGKSTAPTSNVPNFQGVKFGAPASVAGAFMSSSIRRRMADNVAQKQAMLDLLAQSQVVEEAAKPPKVLVDAVCSTASGDVKQKVLLRHVIVKDLNKVAKQLKFEVPTMGIFANKAPMGMYCIFDGLSGAGNTGPAAAEFCARNFHSMLLKCLCQTATRGAANLVEVALARSLEMLDEELQNSEIEDGCGAVIALLVADRLFIALLGRCAAILCEVDSEGRRHPKVLGKGPGALPRSLGDKALKSAGKASSTPDAQMLQLRGSEKHPFLLLAASTVAESLTPADMISMSEAFNLQPRVYCGEVTARASFVVPATSPCTAVQVNFLPDVTAAADSGAPAAKKARLSVNAPPPGSMRLRHILVKFHEGPKLPDDPKAKWASRSRAEAEKMLRGAFAEIRQDQKEWTKTPKDAMELISLSSKKFTQLARQISDCQTAQKGALACGDLGWLTEDGRAKISDSFREVCNLLQPGQWSDIVGSPQGVHLVQRIA